MLAPVLALGGLIFARPSLACGDYDAHAPIRRMQPGATPSMSWPTVPLEWGDINVLHTTDTHGWLLGHLKTSQPEPNYSGDFGDFASFVSHMKDTADKKGVDLLVVDSGDLHDGNGLSDGYPVGGVDGQMSNEFLLKIPYDVMAIGNHELYQYPVSLDMHQNFAPRLNGRYLSSNVNITVLDKNSNPVSTPLGARFAKFRTKHKRKVTAFGVLFEFTGGNANTTVQKVAAMVNETWFTDAIQEEPDLFLLVGHMPVQKDKWPVVFNAIRAVHPTTPILVFGGHTHIRDCVQLDNRSMSLESGQYMETIGWMSAKLDKNTSAPLAFSRRYLDANRNTYQFHTQNKNFDTPGGKKITSGMTALAKKWNLTEVWGTAPQDYYLNRVQYPNNASLVSLLIEQVVPKALAAANPDRAALPYTAIIDTGSQRFDLYSGPFTRNDQFIVSPFTNVVMGMSVPAGIASHIIGRLNGNSAARRSEGEDMEAYARGEIGYRYGQWRKEQYASHHVARADAGLTLGYVTTDSCPGVGDDTLHEPTAFYDPPKYVSLPFPTNISSDTPVDVIFFDFYQSKVLTIVNTLSAGSGKNYSASDVFSYGAEKPLLTNAMYEPFVKEVWAAGASVGTGGAVVDRLAKGKPPYPTRFLLGSLYGI